MHSAERLDQIRCHPVELLVRAPRHLSLADHENTDLGGEELHPRFTSVASHEDESMTTIVYTRPSAADLQRAVDLPTVDEYLRYRPSMGSFPAAVSRSSPPRKSARRSSARRSNRRPAGAEVMISALEGASDVAQAHGIWPAPQARSGRDAISRHIRGMVALREILVGAVVAGWGRCRVRAGWDDAVRARGVAGWMRAVRDAGVSWHTNPPVSLALGS